MRNNKNAIKEKGTNIGMGKLLIQSHLDNQIAKEAQTMALLIE